MKQNSDMFFRFIFWAALLVLLGGCAGVDMYMHATAPQITDEQEDAIGAAAQERLVQILGGHYHDKVLAARLKQLGKEVGCQLSIADRSAVGGYALPGRHVIVTRGLLTRMESRKQLAAWLRYLSAKTRTAYSDHAGYSLSRAVREFLNGEPSRFNPDAADIKVARIFAEKPCDGVCLEKAYPIHGSATGSLPKEFDRLKELQPGYALLRDASNIEKSGDQGRAITAYLQAATEAPDEPRILSALGMAYLRAGELQSARLHLQKAHRLQPDYYKTKMGLGYLYLQTGKVEQASAVLADSVRLLPVTENLFLLAEAREKNGDTKSAFALYRRVVEHDRYSKLGRTAAMRLKEAKGRK